MNYVISNGLIIFGVSYAYPILRMAERKDAALLDIIVIAAIGGICKILLTLIILFRILMEHFLGVWYIFWRSNNILNYSTIYLPLVL